MIAHSVWIVWGGIFLNTDWKEIEPGTEEMHGPFHDEEAALKVWRDETRRKVDIATHRLFVMKAIDEVPDPTS